MLMRSSELSAKMKKYFHKKNPHGFSSFYYASFIAQSLSLGKLFSCCLTSVSIIGANWYASQCMGCSVDGAGRWQIG